MENRSHRDSSSHRVRFLEFFGVPQGVSGTLPSSKTQRLWPRVGSVLLAKEEKQKMFTEVALNWPGQRLTCSFSRLFSQVTSRALSHTSERAKMDNKVLLSVCWQCIEMKRLSAKASVRVGGMDEGSCFLKYTCQSVLITASDLSLTKTLCRLPHWAAKKDLKFKSWQQGTHSTLFSPKPLPVLETLWKARKTCEKSQQGHSVEQACC